MSVVVLRSTRPKRNPAASLLPAARAESNARVVELAETLAAHAASEEQITRTHGVGGAGQVYAERQSIREARTPPGAS